MEKELFPLLKEADRIVIYSLYPVPRRSLEKKPDAAELAVAFELYGDDARAKMSEADRAVAGIARKSRTFQGYPILGKVVVKKAGEIPPLLEKLRSSMLTWEESEGDSDCHDPRHAVLIVKGDRRLRFSICFDCGNTFLKGAPASDGARTFFHFSEEFQKVLEDKFKATGAIHRPYGKHFPKPAAK